MAFVSATDLDRARAFYEGVLRLRVVEHDGFALSIDAHGTPLRVTQAEVVAAPYTVLGWQVTDIEATVRGLQARGVAFQRYGFLEQDALGVWTAPSGARVAWFKDPDENILSVSEL